MDKKLVAATALAGSVAMASFVWGTAQATPALPPSVRPVTASLLWPTKAVAAVAAVEAGAVEAGAVEQVVPAAAG